MAIVSIHNWRQFILCQKEFYTSDMQSVLQNLDYLIENPYKVLKDDPASTVVVIKVDGHSLVVKRANIKDWTYKVRRFFACSRAMKNWRNAHKLLKMGVPTFTPIAIKEERYGPFKLRSYFICTYIQGIDALHFFAKGAKPQSSWKNVAVSISNIIDLLAKHWISHRDLNPSNIILVDNQPWLIDLDSMRQHHFHAFAKRGAKRERARFMENWLDSPGVAPETIDLFQEVLTNFR